MDEQGSCQQFVNDHLLALDHHLKQYQTDLNMKANDFPGYSLTIQKMIETYIEQKIVGFRQTIEHQVKLLHYDYQIEALKQEYSRHNPNVYQVSLVEKEIRCRLIEYSRFN